MVWVLAAPDPPGHPPRGSVPDLAVRPHLGGDGTVEQRVHRCPRTQSEAKRPAAESINRSPASLWREPRGSLFGCISPTSRYIFSHSLEFNSVPFLHQNPRESRAFFVMLTDTSWEA
jgi:hypothetical protein